MARVRPPRGGGHAATPWNRLELFFSVWGELGQHERARQPGEDTLTRSCQVLGDDHFSTLLAAQALALCPVESGQYEQARQRTEDTFARCRRVFGDGHPFTQLSAESLAAVLAYRGEHDQAREGEG